MNCTNCGKKSKTPWIVLGVSLFLLIVIVSVVIVLIVTSGPDQSNPDTVCEEFIQAISENDCDTALELLYPAVVSQIQQKTVTPEAAYAYIRNEILEDLGDVDLTFSNVEFVSIKALSDRKIIEARQESSAYSGYIYITTILSIEGTCMNDGLRIFNWKAEVALADGKYYIGNFTMELAD